MPAVAQLQRPLQDAGSDADASSAAAATGDRAQRLLSWYDRERRELPWRAAPGETPDPYCVWLSEIMLQQTTVKAVIPFFEAFTRRWPTVEALAAVSEDDILAAWAGLGYYSRARNLHRCARAIVTEHGGRFPRTEAGLRELPGIGPYTAAAIAAIAFGQASSPVDGNIERVVARLFAIETPLPKAKPELRALAATLTPMRRAGDFAQAMMDLGATVCAPKRPSCLVCPLSSACAGHARGIATRLPARLEKAVRPVRHGIAFVAMREDGHILVRRRPDAGLLARMLEVPSTEWREDRVARAAAFLSAPVRGDWWPVPAPVIHTFTHFRLELDVYRAVVPVETSLTFWADADRCLWLARHDLRGAALPTVMRKVIAAAVQAN